MNQILIVCLKLLLISNSMTFEDFLDEYYPSSERPDDPNYYLIVAMRAAWNAALDVAAELSRHRYIEDYDILGLKTPLNTPTSLEQGRGKGQVATQGYSGPSSTACDDQLRGG
jgi:hypothetical protein